MKRLSLVLAAIGLSAAGGAFAAYPAAADPTEVSVPQLPGGFEVGVSGYFLQPSDTDGDLNYANIGSGSTFTNFNFTPLSSNSFTGNTQITQYKNVAPGYDWGWGANIGYIFPNTGNDVNLSYMNLETQDSNNVTQTAGANITNGLTTFTTGVIPEFPLTAIGFFPAAPFDIGQSEADYDLNQVDLTAGQYINVGCRLSLHPFAGARYSSLDRTLNSDYFGSQNQVGVISTIDEVSLPFASSATALYNINEESDFDGIGPLFGIDASYYLDAGFGLVAHVDGALLVGNIDAKTRVIGIDNQNVIIGPLLNLPALSFSASDLNTAYSKSDSTSRVVPVFDAKGGLNYTYLFNNFSNADLTLEVGYQVSNYDNAVDRLQLGGSNVESSSVGFNGPYASLTLHV